MAVINKKELKPRQPKRPPVSNWHKYYNNPIWLSNRDWYLQEHPVCELCVQHDRIKSADLVHHMIPFGRGVDEKHKFLLLLNPDNYMSLCKTCHTAIHNKDRKERQEVLNYLTEDEYVEAHNLKWLKLK